MCTQNATLNTKHKKTLKTLIQSVYSSSSQQSLSTKLLIKHRVNLGFKKYCDLFWFRKNTFFARYIFKNQLRPPNEKTENCDDGEELGDT